MKDNTKAKRGILSALTFNFISFIGLILLLIWLTQMVFINPLFEAFKKQQANYVCDKIIENIDDDNLSQKVYDMAKHQNFCIVVIKSDLSNVVSAESSPFCFIHKVRLAELLNYGELAKNERYVMVFENEIDHNNANDEENKSLLVAENVIDKKGAKHVIIINGSLVPINSTISLIRIILILITIFMVLLGVALAFIISRRISLPIIKINKATKALSKGEYNFDLPDKLHYQELISLSKTFKETARELSKNDALRKELIANISHDLRTPLTMITGYGEMMMDIPGENTPENIAVIVGEAKRLTGLVNDMMDISKLETGEIALNIEKFNITETIKEILNRYDKMTELSGYVFNFEFKDELYVSGDKIKLTQVLYNLINNAINYTGEDNVISVRQTELEKSVRIEIIDTGEGIPEENIKHIWDRYYKIDKIHVRPHVGSGLGLSIVKNVLSLHKARFGVISRIGYGSNFWFEINKQ